ncbi:hypothetical protein M0R04_14580 [Candidatus Dojkabacteria bacterium]|jgi:hypothetical protein|nr:hypothetical protein [Candidatus Dojkabacteria bacterium]
MAKIKKVNQLETPQSTKPKWLMICIGLFVVLFAMEMVAAEFKNYTLIMYSQPVGAEYIAWKLKTATNSYPLTKPSAYSSTTGATNAWQRKLADYDFGFTIYSGGINVTANMSTSPDTQLGITNTQYGLAQTIMLENITDITAIAVKIYRDGATGQATFWITDTNATNDASNSLHYYNGSFDSSGITTNVNGAWYIIPMEENTTLTRPVTDVEYPTFSNYWDTNSTLINTGVGYFNVTLAKTNGTVFLEINNTNITASNFTADVYNVSYNFLNADNYTYRWHSWGNGTSHFYNNSGAREYTVNASAHSASALSIIFPENNKYYNYVLTTLNFTILNTSEMNLCWYSIDIGATNTTTPCGGNVTGLTSVEGLNNWMVGANNSYNDIANTSVSFTMDTIFPLISYGNGILPNYANVSQTSVYVNTTWTEANFDNITFRIYNTSWTNSSFFSTPTYSINFTNLRNGNYYYNATICDKVNHCNTTSYNVNLLLDTLPPNATQGTTDSGGSYTVSVNNTVYNTTSQNFTVKANDTYGIDNITITITNASGAIVNQTVKEHLSLKDYIFGIPINLVDGMYTWFANVIDLAGNYITTTVMSFIVDTTSAGFAGQDLNVSWIADANDTSIHNINVTITEPNINQSGIEFNGANRTIYNITGNIFGYNFTRYSYHAPETLPFNWWVKDNASIFSSSIVYNFNVICPTGWKSFNNTYCMEKLNFTSEVNQTRYLAVPDSISAITMAYINLSDRAGGVAGISQNYSNYSLVLYAQPVGADALAWKIATATPGQAYNSNTTWNGTKWKPLGNDVDFMILQGNTITNYSTDSAGTQHGIIASSPYLAQTITLNSTSLANITAISLRLYRDGVPEMATVYIMGTNATNEPDNTKIYYTGRLNASTFTVDTAGAWYNFTMTANETFTYTNYTVNPYLYIGNTNAWNYSGEFKQTNNRTKNLASIINQYLTPAYLVGTNYIIPFTFHSDNSTGLLQYSDFEWSGSGFIENSKIYNLTTYETSQEAFVLDTTYDSSVYSSITADLVYDGTSYASVKSGSGNNALFTNTVNIPLTASVKNNSFYWKLQLVNATATTLVNSSFANQTESTIEFDYCAAGEKQYVNFTFANETVIKENVTASITESTWGYYLGSGAINKSLSYSSATEYTNYTFCFTPPNRTVKVTPSISYTNTESQQRNYNPGIVLYNNNTMTETKLWLLPTQNGIFVTFQVMNIARQMLIGAEITITKLGSIISQQLTGGSGTVTVFLNPNIAYTLTATYPGVQSYNASQQFTLTEYTITLGIATQTTTDYRKGVSMDVEPKSQTLLNNTFYSFNYTVDSNYWSMDRFGYVLYNSSGGVITSNSSTSATGGFLSSYINTGQNNSLIRMEYYFAVNGSYNNYSTYWGVRDYTSGSIDGFFRRLGNYLNAHTDSTGKKYGPFGIDSFGIGIFIFAAIFISMGVLSYKYGVTSSIAVGIVGILATIVLETYGILPRIVFGIPYGMSAVLVIVIMVIAWREM